MKELTDLCPMPWDKHKGKAMIHVPAQYLLWLWHEDKCSGNVKEYIKENLEVLEQETNHN